MIADYSCHKETELDRIVSETHDLLDGGTARSNLARSLELDRSFHVEIARATQNQRFVVLIEQVNVWIEDARRESHRTLKGQRASVEGHAVIADAIRRGDALGAYTAMQDHIAAIAHIVANE